MDGGISFREIKKHCTLKKLFLATKTSNLLGKISFLETTTLNHSLFLWTSISLRFVYICQQLQQYDISAFIALGSANIYLFKINSRNTRKKYEICSKLIINKKENPTGVFTVKCFYCWLWTGKSLLRSTFLCKYYYPKAKDEQMLYLT